MLNPPSLNSPQFTLVGLTNASAAVTIDPNTRRAFTHVLVDNTSGTLPIFVTAGTGAAAPTAVFPASATVPLQGAVVPAGRMLPFEITQDTTFISAIRSAAGATDVYIKFITGSQAI